MSGFLPGPFAPPLMYRSISEWQQLAVSGSLRPDEQLYDPVRGVWERALVTILGCGRTFLPHR